MLDENLAKLYKVKTKALNQAVLRNIERFPADFAFRITKDELKALKEYLGESNLKSQFVTSKWGGRRKLPYVFSEQGVAMLSSVLRSKRAVQVNIMIMRTFIKIRKLICSHKELEEKFRELEKKVIINKSEIKTIIGAIKQLMTPPEKPKGERGILRGDK